MKKPFKVTKRVNEIQYAIRDIIGHAKKLERKGKKITYLNIGDPVKYDFDTPRHIKKALFKAINNGENWYGPSEGLPELKKSICQKEKKVNNINLSPNDIIVTNGVSEGISMVMAAVVEEGDEVLVPGPTYPPYNSYTNFFNGSPIPYKTIEEEDWKPDIEDIEKKITKKTKGIVIINPNNPCGSVYDERVLKKILELAAENNLLVLSDEIYDRIVYDTKHKSTASISGDYPIVGFNGFSKVYLATGWRLGYLYFYDPNGKIGQLKESVAKETRIRLCANTPVQKAGVAALEGPQIHIDLMLKKLRKRRDFTVKRINEISGLSCTTPKGAFYVFPKVHNIGTRWKTDFHFVLDCLNKTGVLFVHGSGFCNIFGKNHFRSVFLPPIEVLEYSFNKLEDFMDSET